MSLDEQTRPVAVGRACSIAVLVTAWGLAAIALLLVPFTQPTWHAGQWFGLVDLSDAVVFGAVASLLLARGRHPVSWLVALCAVGGGLAAVGFQWSMVSTVHPDLPALPVLQGAQAWAWVPGTYAMIIVVPVLVRRVPLRPLDRWFVAMGSGAIGALTLARLTDPFPWPDGAPYAPLPVRSEWWADLIDRTGMWQFALVCALAAVATADLVRRWHHRTPDERRGLGWLAVGAGLMAAAFLPLAVPASWTAELPLWLTPVLHLCSQLFFPAALLVAVLGQRIAGLEFVVGRATLWALCSALLVALYAVIIALGAEVLPTDDGLVIAIATAAVAVSFTPLRTALQRRIDALVRGAAGGPSGAIGDLGRGMITASDDEQLLGTIGESVRHALRLGGLAIEVDWPGGARRVASVGDLVPASTTARDLVVQREVVGRLVVSGRPGEALDAQTRGALDDLAPVVAAVVQLVARTRQLTESRARIAEARDEERRALRRELHDGFGPGLAGVALGLRAADNLLVVDPSTARRLVGEMADELDQRVEEVRTLARGLLPPVLDEGGLVPALVELAARQQITGGVRVEVIADDVEVSAPVRQAVYGVVAEAVRNVVRHAGATTCTITLRTDATGLVVTIDDDGTGLPARPTPGVGLSSMRERATGVGGSLDVIGLVPGTRVVLRIPAEVPIVSAG